MPILTVKAGPGTRFPDSDFSLLQHDANAPPAHDPTMPETPGPSTWEVFSAAGRQTWMQGGVDMLGRPSVNGSNFEPGFNPYAFIQKSELKDDPRVQFLASRGQFDSSFNQDQFFFDLATGYRFLDDSATYERSSKTQAAIAFVGLLPADPSNLIPLGAAAKGGSLLARAGKNAVTFGGFSLAHKAVTDALMPAGNEPGGTDEAISAAAGMGLGAMLPLIGGALTAGMKHIPTTKMLQLRRGLIDLTTRQIDAPDPITVGGTAPAGARSMKPTAGGEDIAMRRLTIPEQYAEGTTALRSHLAAEPVDNTVVTVLRRAKDENDTLLAQLRDKYAAAGKALQVVDHPAQPYYDAMKTVEPLLNATDWNADAKPKDLNGNFVDDAVRALSGTYAGLQAKATPGGRAAQATMAFLHDAWRTVFASSRTVARGSADDPFAFQVGTPAEAMKDVYAGLQEGTTVALREAWAAARRKGEPIIHADGELSSYDDFGDAVTDLIQRQNAKALGFSVPDPAQIHPAVAATADRLRKYFAEMFDQSELSGLFKFGPRALAETEAKLEATKAKFDKAVKRLAAAADDVEKAKAQKWHDKMAQTLATRQAARDALAEKVDAAKHYFPHVWNAQLIKGSPAEFVSDMAYQLRRADEIAAKEQGDARTLHPEVAAKLDIRQLQALHDAKFGKPALISGAAPRLKPIEELAADLTEGDLPLDLRIAYGKELGGHYRAKAGGVLEAIKGNEDFSDSRSLTIDESAMRKWMVTDPEAVLSLYHHRMGGRIALRRAIQLNPVWKGAKLADGTAVESGQHLKTFLTQAGEAVDTLARYDDEIAGKRASTFGKLKSDLSARLKVRIARDFNHPIDMLEGRVTQPEDWMEPFRFMGRQMLRLSMLNKLGGMAVVSLNDLAPATLYSMQSPRTLGAIKAAIMGLEGAARSDMEALYVTFNGVGRARALGELDFAFGTLGFGTGRTRRLSAAFERGARRFEEGFANATGINRLTNAQKIYAGVAVIDRMTNHARLLLKAQTLADYGPMTLAEALDKVGLNHFDAANLNKLGLNAQGARQWLRLIYDHGLTLKGEPISGAFRTFDDFVGAKKHSLVLPNFEEWPRASVADADFADKIKSNISAEVNRSLVVTPGLGDQPAINRGVVGRLFNQFQSYPIAFVNQRLKVMAQMPAKYQAWYAMQYLLLGAVTDALSNEISGRRTLGQTAELWTTNPLGMTYAAWEKSGMGGWLGRPLAISDSLGIPWSPGTLLKNPANSTAARHVNPGKPLTMFGPAFADVDTMFRVAADTAGGKANQQTAYDATKLLPFQNLVWLRLLHRMTGAPVVPEAIRPEPSTPREPAP